MDSYSANLGEPDPSGQPESRELIELALRCDERAPRLARDAFDGVEGLDGVRAVARLVVSELVSNAVRHSGSAAGDLIQVHASRRDGALAVSVTDGGFSGTTPRVRSVDDEKLGGLGLSIVENLSARWGWRRTAEDRCLVWAELSLGSSD